MIILRSDFDKTVTIPSRISHNLQVKKTSSVRTMSYSYHPKDWGLKVSQNGELMVGNHGVVGLARKFGTPLHVVNESRLLKTAQKFLESASSLFPAKTSVHYAFKCNSVPAVVQTVRSAGLNAEVMTEYELELAVRLGFLPDQIIVNGPCKTNEFLRACVWTRVRLIVVDSIDELRALAGITRELMLGAHILLRINPDVVPRKMNRGTATGSRKGCAFGLDLKGGEVGIAFDVLKEMELVRFEGFHFHIGTGIRDPRDYARSFTRMRSLFEQARSMGFPVRVLDVGGGFASMTTREFTTAEMLAYHGLEVLPKSAVRADCASFDDFAGEVSRAVLRQFPLDDLPELVYEPGRCIVSPNQFLLLTVHRVKDRWGIRKWLITDGGLSTVAMPTYYEYHEVFLANDVGRPRTEKVTIIGPACFAGDVVYRNKLMPEVHPGEILAIMDSGAYFTALESSFGFPRPAIVSVNGSTCRLIRTRETFDEMVARDILD